MQPRALTPCLQRLMATGQADFPAYMQLLDLKEIQNKNAAGVKRLRIFVSDGEYQTPLMVSTQAAIEIEQHRDQYVPGSILEFSEIIANEVAQRRVMIAINFRVVAHDAIRGNPPPLPDYGAPQPAAPQQPNASTGNHANNIKPEAGRYGPQGGGYGQAPNMQQGGGYGNAPQGMMNGMQQAAPGPSYGNPPPGHHLPAAPRPGMAGAGPGFVGRANVPAPQYNLHGAGPVARNEAPAAIMPIADLNPYQSRWTIKARVTAKTGLKRYNNAKGEGKIFSFDLLDKGGGEIRATAFNETADRFFDMVQVGRVYLLSKGQLQQKRAQFNNLSHNFEIQLSKDSQLEYATEDPETQAIPAVRFNFTQIASLSEMQVNAFVDVIGIVEQVNDWQTITRKTGEETKKRSLVLRDNSNASIEVTLWGEFADNPGVQLEQLFKSEQRPILGLKAARIGEFNGRNLGTVSSTQVVLEPACPEANTLRNWYNSVGAGQKANPLSGVGGGGHRERRCTLAAIRDENLGREGKADWVTVVTTIVRLGNNSDKGIMYPACQQDKNGRKCQKKMLPDLDGSNNYSCSDCGPGLPMWRYMLSTHMVDHTRDEWLTSFNETSEVLMRGVTADQFREMEREDPSFKDRITGEMMYQPLICRIKVAEDNYNDEVRVKLNLFKVEKANYVKEGQLLLEMINKLEAGQPVLVAKDGQQQQQQHQGMAGRSAGGYGGSSNNGFGGAAGGGYGMGGPTQAPGGYGGYGAPAAGGYSTPPRQQPGNGGYGGGGYGANNGYGSGPQQGGYGAPAPQYGAAPAAAVAQNPNFQQGGAPRPQNPGYGGQQGGYSAPGGPNQQPYGGGPGNGPTNQPDWQQQGGYGGPPQNRQGGFYDSSSSHGMQGRPPQQQQPQQQYGGGGGYGNNQGLPANMGQPMW